MADTTPLLPQMSAAADDREIVFNGTNDALSPASLFGKNYQTTTGLVWGYIGGFFSGVDVPNGTVTATASNTNYVVAHRTTGAVTISTATTNYNNQVTYLRLWVLTAGASTITAWLDKRQAIGPDVAGTITITREIQYACSDLTTAIATGLVASFRAPRAMTISSIVAALETAQSAGSTFTIDIKENGTTIFSTLLTFDNTEETTTTAATPAVISDSAIAADAKITTEVTQIGNGTAMGLSVTIFYT